MSRPGDNTPPVHKTRIAEATGTENLSKLTAGVSYDGKVITRESDGTYTVDLFDPKITLSGVRLALPILGGLMGLQVRGSVPPQTPVKLVYGKPSHIYAGLSENTTDWLNAKNRSILWGPDMDGEMGVLGDLFATHAEDLLEGEVEFSNLYGVAMEFLTTLMRMKAGDLAAVECHLINDMVRIISRQFRHISGMGEDLLFDHGRPTMERTWSMYRHEVLGLEEEKEAFATLNGDEVDRDEMSTARITRIGRHRFREFIGFAGDFIHSFVTDPPTALVSLASGAAGAGGGKSWIHRNSDGSVLVQSVADIRFERVTRIPVPVRYAHHEDPTVTAAREYESLEAAFVTLPSGISPTDPEDSFQLAYHIRSYSRWLGRYHAFARMLQLGDEYEIPSEVGSPAPDWRNKEADRENANGGVTYYDAYSCFAQLRDGSMLMYDGYGSSVVMSNGNIQVAATRHVDVEAAGDIRFIAGGSILMKARRNIELVATFGGIVMYGFSWLKMLCEKGTLWLRSNAATGKDDSDPEPYAAGLPAPEIAGRTSGLADGYGVLVEAAAGGAAIRSQRGLSLAVDGTPTDEDDTSFDVTVSTRGSAKVYGKAGASLGANGDVSVVGNRMALSCQKLLSDAPEMFFGAKLSAPSIIFRNGKLWCKALESDQVEANALRGPEVGPEAPKPDPTPKEALRPHFNHVGTLTSAIATPAAADAEALALATSARASRASLPVLPWVTPSGGPKWSFPAREEYIWDTREKAAGVIPETLSQQYLRLDGPVGVDRWGGAGYTDWNVRLGIGGPRTNSRGGFGYYELQYQASDEGESLHAPSATPAADLGNVVVEWKPKSQFSIRALKRDEEV